MTLKTKITLIFTAIILVGGGFLYFVYYQGGLSRGLEIAITGPEKVSIGLPFEIKVEAANVSQSPLEEVRLSINLPVGIAFLGSPPAKNVDFRDLKTINPGRTVEQTIRLIALSDENTFKRIEAAATFLSGNLSSRFEKKETYDLAVGNYGITLDIATPQSIFSGEPFDIELSYKNVSDTDLDNLRLKMEYPPTYTLVKAALPPDIGNNIWVLGGLRKGSENKFRINGKMLGPEGAFFDIKATIEAGYLGQNYPININVATLSIATSPLSLRVSLNEEPDYIARAGDPLNYTITYSNNTDVALRDVVIRAQLVGGMFDFGTLSTNGTFRSLDSTLIWNASNLSNLSALSPGQSGSVSFSLRAKQIYPIRRLSDKNFILKVTGTIESPTVPNFVAADKTVGFATLETKVAGQADVETRVFFRDSAAGVANSGPWPPKANRATQYTVHWLITSQGTDLRDVEVKAFLGGNARFIKVIKSAGNSAPVYNDRTQEVIWTISKVPATTGVISGPLEAIFQIEATPSSTDVGRYIELIKDTFLKAVDDFTGLDLSDVDNAVTTQLPDDPTVSPAQGVVVQ